MPQDLRLINAIYFYAPHLYPYPTGQTQRCLRQLSGSNRSEFEARCFSAPDVTALFIFGCEPRWPDRRCHHSTAAPYIYELDSLCSIYTLTFKIPEGTPPHYHYHHQAEAEFAVENKNTVGGADGWIDSCTSPTRMYRFSN